MVEVSEETLVGRRPVGDARFAYLRTYVEWFDHWLKDEQNAVATMPKVRSFVLGRGEWRVE